MQWNFIICLLLASAVLANPRPKRSLGNIKNHFANKLFGSNKVVIAQPVLAQNKTHQLFKIPGYNDILIKVCRKDEPKRDKDKAKPAKPEDAIIVKPEVAIIGSYLGMATQKETLLAIDMVRNLINSGVLSDGRDSSVQELVIPFTPQLPRLKYFEDQNVPLNVYEEDHVFVPMSLQEVVAPVQAKYSYKQEGIDADMTYKSYDSKDVIVTRTEKEPPLPHYIMLRIAEIANIAANPFTKRPKGVNGHQIPYLVNPGQPQIVSSAPFPYYEIPGVMMPEYVQKPEPYLIHGVPRPLGNGPAKYGGNNRGSIIIDRNPILLPEPIPIDDPTPYFVHPGATPEYVQGPYSSQIINGAAEYGGNSINGGPILVDRNPILLTEPMPFGSSYHVANNMQFNRCKGTLKICSQKNIQLKDNKLQNIESKFVEPNNEPAINKAYNNKSEINANAYKIAVNEFFKNHTVNGQIVSQYSYRQMNPSNRFNYTEVKTGDDPQFEGTGVEKSNDSYKDYVFVPPKGTISPMQSAISLKNKPGNDRGSFPYYDIPGVMMPEYVQGPKPYLIHGVPQPLGNFPAEYDGNNRGVYGSPVMVDRNPILLPEPLPNVGPLPYYVNPGAMPEYKQGPYSSHRIPQPHRNGADYVGNNIHGGSIMIERNPTLLPEPIGSPYHVANNMLVNGCTERGTIKICPQVNIKSGDNKSPNTASKFDKPKQQNNPYDNKSEINANAYKIAVNEFLKNYTVNGKIVSQYSYKQMNHHSRLNNTAVKLKEAPQNAGTGLKKSNNDSQKDYVFVPPKGVKSPMQSALSLIDKPGNGRGPFPYYDIPGVMMPEYVQGPEPYLLHGIPQPIRNGPTEYVGNNRGVFGGPLMVDRNPILLPEPLPNVGPLPYYVNPDLMSDYKPRPFSSHRISHPPRNGAAELVGNNINGGPIIVDRNPILLPEPLPFGSPYHVASNIQVNRCKGTIKICPQDNIQLDKRRKNIVSNFDKPKQQAKNKVFDNESESNANAYKTAVNEFLKKQTVNGQIVSQYSYKQMNHNSRLNYTEVKTGKAPQFEGTEDKDEKITIDSRKNYDPLPHKSLQSSKLSVSLNSKPGNGKIGEHNAFISKMPSNGVLVNHKQYVPSLQSYPIVVSEQLLNTEIREKCVTDKKINDFVKTEKSFDDNNNRGDIPGATF